MDLRAGLPAIRSNLAWYRLTFINVDMAMDMRVGRHAIRTNQIYHIKPIQFQANCQARPPSD